MLGATNDGIPRRPIAIYEHEVIVIYHLEFVHVTDGQRVKLRFRVNCLPP